MMWRSPYLLTAAILLLGTGCGSGTHTQVPSKSRLPEKAAKVIAAQNDFAFRLLDQILTRDASTANKLISPLSVYLALSMVYNGCATSTQKGMAVALGLEDIGTGALNTTHAGLLTQLPKADPAIILDMSNSLWYKNTGTQPLPGFLKTIRSDYRAQVSGAAFDASTVTRINDWVAAQTHHKITSILEKIDPSDVMYLTSAVYFKGAWKGAFDPAATAKGVFHNASGDLQVPFMAREARYNYLENDSVQLIELPYGNGAFSMYVALPAAGTDLDGWVKGLDRERFHAWVSSMDSAKVKLRIPKWQYSYQVNDLKSDLASLGMGEAFTPKADFSAMYPKGAKHYISKALHKSYIEVNEQGTEAAAVTSIGMTVTSMPLHPTPIMEVNRPFLYVIGEKKTGCLLFMGVVNDPLKN